MNKRLRLALVGCGGRGLGMIDIASSFNDIELIALCDNNSKILKKASEKFPKAEVFDDFTTMLDNANLDILLVETPAKEHAEFAVEALKHNINVMTDIPCVSTLEEADELWEAQKNSSAMFMTGANPNMQAFIRSMQKVVKKDLIGKPSYIECEYIHDCRCYWEETPWRKTMEPIIYCTHSLGPMLTILKDDLRYVSCFDTGSHINNTDDQHDLMSALFRTEDNTIVRLMVSFINEYPDSHHHYRIIGTKGAWERSVDYGDGEQCYFYSKDIHEEQKFYPTSSGVLLNEYIGNPNAKGHGGCDYALWDALIKALRSNEKIPPISLRQGLQMSIPGIFAAQSAANGGELTKITYPWDK
ncbi:MAG: Gfo/Idh/MocA family oxidoreductase [Verrucomicrobiota bacterium]|nr:Gfo/Idh/MocA family oxidoreductase [Verrucomicrobiota bacterium]